MPHASASLLSALIVDPDDDWRVETEAVLASAGFAVVVARTYKDAVPLLLTARPTLLITEVRLGAYNGLQLAIRGHAERPDMALIVASAFTDAVLQRESEQFGATFVEKPVASDELLAAVHRTVARRHGEARALEPIRPPFERRHAERRQRTAAVAEDRRTAERRRGLSAVLLDVAMPN